MNAMVLAAGFGTRMKPLTDHLPKALLPIHGKPLIEMILNQLQSQGFDKIAVNAHYHAGKIKTF
ncbi:MAG: nucleotidyltransferase family protein, partial [Calditrichaeota bacterium]